MRTYEIGNESKLQVEITFKQNIMLLLEIGWPLLSIQWYTYVNSFHQLSYFEFAVYFEWDEKLRTYEIGNESKLQVEITFKQNIMLHLEIGWP